MSSTDGERKRQSSKPSTATKASRRTAPEPGPEGGGDAPGALVDVVVEHVAKSRDDAVHARAGRRRSRRPPPVGLGLERRPDPREHVVVHDHVRIHEDQDRALGRAAPALRAAAGPIPAGESTTITSSGGSAAAGSPPRTVDRGRAVGGGHDHAVGEPGALGDRASARRARASSASAEAEPPRPLCAQSGHGAVKDPLPNLMSTVTPIQRARHHLRGLASAPDGAAAPSARSRRRSSRSSAGRPVRPRLMPERSPDVEVERDEEPGAHEGPGTPSPGRGRGTKWRYSFSAEGESIRRAVKTSPRVDHRLRLRRARSGAPGRSPRGCCGCGRGSSTSSSRGGSRRTGPRATTGSAFGKAGQRDRRRAVHPQLGLVALQRWVGGVAEVEVHARHDDGIDVGATLARAQLRGKPGRDPLVGVQRQDPVAGRRVGDARCERPRRSARGGCVDHARAVPRGRASADAVRRSRGPAR